MAGMLMSGAIEARAAPIALIQATDPLALSIQQPLMPNVPYSFLQGAAALAAAGIATANHTLFEATTQVFRAALRPSPEREVHPTCLHQDAAARADQPIVKVATVATQAVVRCRRQPI